MVVNDVPDKRTKMRQTHRRRGDLPRGRSLLRESRQTGIISDGWHLRWTGDVTLSLLQRHKAHEQLLTAS